MVPPRRIENRTRSAALRRAIEFLDLVAERHLILTALYPRTGTIDLHCLGDAGTIPNTGAVEIR